MIRLVQPLPFVSKDGTFSDNPEQYIKNVKAIYDVLLIRSMSLITPILFRAQYVSMKHGRMNDTEMLAAKYRELYKEDGKKHPILTSSEDILCVVLLAMTDDKDVDTIINEELKTAMNILRKT